MENITLYESLFFYCDNLSSFDSKIFRVKGGMASLVRKLVTKVSAIKLSEKAVSLSEEAGGALIQTNKNVYKAKSVVFACSLSNLNNLYLPEKTKKIISNWLSIGFYGGSVKGILKLLSDPFPDKNYLITPDPIRMIRRSKNLWEFYLPSLHSEWTRKKIEEKLMGYFDDVTIVEIREYSQTPFLGCYWNYKKGCFNRIFEASRTYQIGENIFCVGEHFSLNPNWIEGTLESVDFLMKKLKL